MGGISDQMLHYGGLVIAGVALVAAVLFGFAYTIAKMRLRTRLDEEYGRDERN